MKNISEKLLAAETVFLGLIGAGLQMLLYHFGREDSGLMVRFHPASLGFWLLAAAAAILFFLQRGKKTHEKPHAPIGILPGLACIFMGLALGAFMILAETRTAFDRVDRVLGLAAAAGFLGAGILRITGRKPLFWFHALGSVFFLVHLITVYQQWRSLTQLAGISVEMGAVLLLTLYAYHQAALDLSESARADQRFYGALTGFFCIAAVPGSEAPLLYLGAACWTVLNLLGLPEERKG